MKYYSEYLKKQIDIPDGWYVVKSGKVKNGDKLFWSAYNKFYGAKEDLSVGNDVDDKICVIRKSKPKNYFVLSGVKHKFPDGYVRIKSGKICAGDMCFLPIIDDFNGVKEKMVGDSVINYICIIRPTNSNAETKTENTIISEPVLASSPPVWTEDMIIEAVKPYYKELDSIAKQAIKLDISVAEVNNKITEIESILMKILKIGTTDYEKYSSLVKKLNS